MLELFLKMATNSDKQRRLCYTSPMKLSQYARQQGISCRTALRWWQAGLIPGYQAATGTIIVTEQEARIEEKPEEVVAIYARISSHDQRANLERQVKRLKDYCAAKGYRIQKVVKEIGFGVNDNRARVPKAAGRSADYPNFHRTQRPGHALWLSLRRSAAAQLRTNARSGESGEHGSRRFVARSGFRDLLVRRPALRPTSGQEENGSDCRTTRAGGTQCN